MDNRKRTFAPQSAKGQGGAMGEGAGGRGGGNVGGPPAGEGASKRQ